MAWRTLEKSGWWAFWLCLDGSRQSMGKWVVVPWCLWIGLFGEVLLDLINWDWKEMLFFFSFPPNILIHYIYFNFNSIFLVQLFLHSNLMVVFFWVWIYCGNLFFCWFGFLCLIFLVCSLCSSYFIFLGCSLMFVVFSCLGLFILLGKKIIIN